LPLRDGLDSGGAVGDHQPERHVRGDHLPHRLGSGQLADQPFGLPGAEDAAVGHGLGVGAVGVPVGAHVQHEHVQQRPVAQHPVDPAGVVEARLDRQVLVERLRGAGGQHVRPLLGVARVLQDLAGPPVVVHLVVVPLVELRRLAQQCAPVVGEQVVAELPAELVQCLGHLGFLRGDQVVPQ